MGDSFETSLRRSGDVMVGLCCFVILRHRYDIPIRHRRDAPLRRLGNVPSRRRWVFYLRRTGDVAGTYRETLLRRRHDVLMPGGDILLIDETKLLEDSFMKSHLPTRWLTKIKNANG